MNIFINDIFLPFFCHFSDVEKSDILQMMTLCIVFPWKQPSLLLNNLELDTKNLFSIGSKLTN